jgi:Fur family zinc uptake transcriptional regulator
VMDLGMERMVQVMSNHGLRVTEQRRTLARLFAEASGFLSAKEVYVGLEEKHSGLSFDTVYRNLRLLQELGVLEQFHFEDGMKFRVGCFGHKHHHHHLICLSCDQIYPLEFCPMDHIPNIPNHFKIVKHQFEVYGYCEDCQKQGSPTTIHETAFV